MTGRKWIAVAVMVGLTLAVPGVSNAAKIAPPVRDSVRGSADSQNSLHQLGLAVDAESGPSGESPTGNVSIVLFRRPPCFGLMCGIGELTGPVTCLGVDGNTATLNFRAAISPGVIVTVDVVDDQPDTIDFVISSRAPTDCSPASGVPAFSVVAGDITVVDAVPPPTARAQCKNGGSQQFGFANQGQCVRFVQQPGRDGDL